MTPLVKSTPVGNHTFIIDASSVCRQEDLCTGVCAHHFKIIYFLLTGAKHNSAFNNRFPEQRFTNPAKRTTWHKLAMETVCSELCSPSVFSRIGHDNELQRGHAHLSSPFSRSKCTYIWLEKNNPWIACCFRQTVGAECSSPCRPAGGWCFGTFRRPLIRSYRVRKSLGDSSGKSSSRRSSSVISALSKKTFWAIPLSSPLRARAASASAMIPLPGRESHVTRLCLASREVGAVAVHFGRCSAVLFLFFQFTSFVCFWKSHYVHVFPTAWTKCKVNTVCVPSKWKFHVFTQHWNSVNLTPQVFFLCVCSFTGVQRHEHAGLLLSHFLFYLKAIRRFNPLT